MAPPGDQPEVCALLEALPGAAFLVEVGSQGLPYWNARAGSLYGPLTGNSRPCCLLSGDPSPPCQRAGGSCPLAEAEASGAAAEAELAQGPDGKPVRVRAAPIRDSAGVLRWIVVTHESVGARAPSGGEADEGDARYRLFFEEGPLGMAITLPDKGWAYVNPRLCAMLGYSEDELRTMTGADLTHPEDLEADLREFDRVCHGEIDG